MVDDLLQVAVAATGLCAGLYLILVRWLAGLRLTDWLGYFVSTGIALFTIVRLFTTPWPWVGVLLAGAGSILWARATARLRSREPGRLFNGMFFVGKPAHPVQDWPEHKLRAWLSR